MKHLLTSLLVFLLVLAVFAVAAYFGGWNFKPGNVDTGMTVFLALCMSTIAGGTTFAFLKM